MPDSRHLHRRPAINLSLRPALRLVGWIVLMVANILAASGAGSISGHITDPQGKAVADAKIAAVQNGDSRILETRSDSLGRFAFPALPAGDYKLVATAPGFVDASQAVNLQDGQVLTLNSRFDRLASLSQSVTVTADVTAVDVESPDAAMKVYDSEDLLDANPGRPGAPISIPGYPIETASSGIKAPQYFAPGVAGDHGEPIAMFTQVGSLSLCVR